MKNVVFPSKFPVTLPIVGNSTQFFPVRRVYCVGQNYASHAKEMGNTDAKVEPFFFSKPADAVIVSPAVIKYPVATKELHHEVELVVAIGKGGANIAAADALSHVFGYAVGLDLTRRDMQKVAKAKGRPWDLAKGFDESAPCSPILPILKQAPLLRSGTITLNRNGKQVQHGDLSDMILSVDKLIALLSTFVTLEPGDLVFTGTPEGVGPVEPGDVLQGSVEGVGSVSLTVQPRAKL